MNRHDSQVFVSADSRDGDVESVIGYLGKKGPVVEIDDEFVASLALNFVKGDGVAEVDTVASGLQFVFAIFSGYFEEIIPAGVRLGQRDDGFVDDGGSPYEVKGNCVVDLDEDVFRVVLEDDVFAESVGHGVFDGFSVFSTIENERVEGDGRAVGEPAFGVDVLNEVARCSGDEDAFKLG